MKIDFKNCTIRLLGRPSGYVILPSMDANADLRIDDNRAHVGIGNDDTLTIELKYPGSANQPLTITVIDPAITVNLATGPGLTGIISTAAEVKAAIDNHPEAKELIKVTVENDGSGTVDAFGITAIAYTQDTLIVKVGDGNLTYSEKRSFNYDKEKGKLDTVHQGDEEAVEVRSQFNWTFLKSNTAGIPTVEEVLKHVGEASDWISTGKDCEPYAVDIEVEHIPICPGTKREITVFQEFRIDSLDHDLKAATVAFTGKSNKVEADILRIT